jgi:hypothetical protein
MTSLQFLLQLSHWDFRVKTIGGQPVNAEAIATQMHDAFQLVSELRRERPQQQEQHEGEFCTPILWLFSMLPAGKTRSDLIKAMHRTGAIDDCVYFTNVGLMDASFTTVLTVHSKAVRGEPGFERWRNIANDLAKRQDYVRLSGVVDTRMYSLRLLVYIQLWEQLLAIPWNTEGLNSEHYNPVSSEILALLAVALRNLDKKADRDWLLSLVRLPNHQDGSARVLHPVQLVFLLREQHIFSTRPPSAEDKALFEKCLQAYERLAKLDCLYAFNELTVYNLVKTFISFPADKIVVYFGNSLTN